MPDQDCRSLPEGFLESAEAFPDRPALCVDNETVTYADLRTRAATLSHAISARAPEGGSPLTAVFAQRSVTAFAGVLGALLAGRGYVPLNPSFPRRRTRAMLESADCRSIVVDAAAEDQLIEIAGSVAERLLILMPDRGDVAPVRAALPQHDVLGCRDLREEPPLRRPAAAPDDLAYLLFTSGSTGAPKGVMVTHRNAVHFVEIAARRYDIGPADRLSQTFELTFDLSVFDMFVAWARGACVCCPSAKTLLNPHRFITEMELTVWFSVPTLAQFMRRLGGVKAGAYPSLRWSLFCGEPLPVALAKAWQTAAPNGSLENLYGPTEVTVACTAHRWAGDEGQTRDGIVPIGHPLPGMRAIVVDERLHSVAAGELGELLMSGPQVTPGYWRNEAATAAAFVRVPGESELFYRTGDRVRRPAANGPLTYVGRADQQIKVLGHRVELGEVEAVLRRQPGVEAAVAVGWPATPSGAAAVVAFVTGERLDPARVQAGAAMLLQPYAVPRTVHVVPDLPRGASGKIDRGALLSTLR